ncbi:four-carbon acid sugar kinase family protein [Peptoniphilus equinus]|uniref:Four-carbon acid sugar kinase family protein n=1 Tax=Peptoniphilus equinus TaxID=3016343 RepID=A0ABY7QRG8_9FIRM|nr:four-carbon acid sugar kinase family protein [Peptoniphilus equinus]WBW49384.1 four-carbon acid sugar kinase family protein [Peptoniphilus equinus]
MSECIVIADDLTGGNATGVLLKKMNYRAHTVLNLSAIDPIKLAECECVIYPTNSRGLDAQAAYDRVYEACETLASKDVRLYSHRIDSTLRGNLGSETDAMLDVLGEDYIAVCAPCFPATARIVCGGYMLVGGVPLHKTNIAFDPKTPVNISEVAELFRRQSRYGVVSVRLKELMAGKHHLADVINAHVEAGHRIICFDCISQEDLDLIADACIESGRNIVAVDPGVFTTTLARKLIVPRDKQVNSRILAVVGSVNPNARTQIEALWLAQITHRVMIETKKLLESETARQHEIDRVIEDVMSGCRQQQVTTIVSDGIYPENRLDFTLYMKKLQCSLDEVTAIINSAFAQITYEIFKQEPSFRAMYTSGGDITVAVCERFGTVGLRLRDEVLPLAAYGKILGGAFDGVHIITKGGSQGGPDAINLCITYLKEKLYI